MKTTSTLIAGIAVVAAQITFAGGTLDQYQTLLKSVPAPEMPAKTAELVYQAKLQEKEITTVNAVKAAVAVNPSATPLVVGAISRSVPAVAPVAAATAISLQPAQARVIKKAAVSAAPSQAARIEAALRQQSLPGEIKVGAGAPETKEVLARTATPAVKVAAGPITVASPAPPRVGPPFTPQTQTPTEVDRSDSTEVPPGTGRTYSGP